MSDQPPAKGAVYLLPPLILHPFSDVSASLKVLESAKAAAQMIGVGPQQYETRVEELRTRLLDGRYAEFRMLYFVGKDVFRWISQCVDFAQRTEGLKDLCLVEQCFAELLIGQTPEEVAAKLRRWGVADFARIFARSIGIYMQFQEPPPVSILAPDYLRFYFRYADYSYACWKDSASFPTLSSGQYTFLLYASGEYSKLLEEQWKA